MTSCPTSWVISVDQREKTPLPLPDHLVILDPTRPAWHAQPRTLKLHTIRRTLSEGDYALESHPSSVLVERKGSLREVSSNCLGRDRDRFLNCLNRLQRACAYPVLFLEDNPRRKHKDDDRGLDALMRLCFERSISLVIMPTSTITQRRLAGERIARLLINGALAHVDP